MHAESHQHMDINLAKYAEDARTFLEVGSRRVAPHDLAYRSLVLSEYLYIGVDAQDGDNVDVVADAIELPFIDGLFDAVLCGQVLEHVRNPFRVVGEIARVLKAGGAAMLVAPQVWRVHRYPIDTFRYNPDGMAAVMEESGLQTLDAYTVPVVGGRFDCWGVGKKL